MQYYNFQRLINKFSTTFTAIIPSEGEYNASGDYVVAETEIKLTGAIIAHRESKVFRSEGAITQQDMALYMLQPLEKGLQGAKVVHKGKIYRIADELTNGDFTGVWVYNLKYVSAFNEGGGE